MFIYAAVNSENDIFMVIKAPSKSGPHFLLEKDLEKQRVLKCSTKSLHPKQLRKGKKRKM